MRGALPPSLVLAAALVLPSGGRAVKEQPAPSADAAADGYCAFVQGVADAKSSLLLWPDLFGAAALVGGGTALTGDETLPFGTTARLTAGARYSFSRLFRGLLVKDRAEVECRRYLALAKLRAAMQGARKIGRAEALEAKIAVLREALPEAEAILSRQREAMEHDRGTVDELFATQLRVDNLRAQLRAAEAELSSTRASTRGPPTTADALFALVAEAEAAEEEIQAVHARIRELGAWDVDLRGGYDQTFLPLERIPVFGVVQLSYNLGGLFMPSAHERAREGLKAEQRADPHSERAGLRQLIDELRAAVRAEQMRLVELSVLHRDLERQLEMLGEVDGPHAQRYREYLFFESTKMRAERAHTEAHIAAVRAFLGEAAPPPPAPSSAAEVEPEPLAPPLPAWAAAAVPASALDVTLGTIEAQGSRFRIADGKVRAVLKEGRHRRAALRFRYLGPAREQAPLASGKMREQVGLKLRARDGCNLVYVMWRLEPADGVVVQVKSNPADATHAKCGAGGYETVKPEKARPMPKVMTGTPHVLAAKLEGDALLVSADGELVWQGKVPKHALAADGPAGIRTDNVTVDAELFVAP